MADKSGWIPDSQETGFVADDSIGWVPDALPIPAKTDILSPFDKESVLLRSGIPLSEARRPVLEYGGMMAGGALATPLSIMTGNPAPTIAGGGLGYAGGKLVADYIDEKTGRRPIPGPLERVAETGKGFVEGALMQGAGEAIGSGLSMARKSLGPEGAIGKRLPPWMVKTLEERAAEILTKIKGTSPQYDKNAAAAEILEDLIPGWKATMGERTADPGLIKLQRGFERGPTKEAADIMAQQKEANAVALREYLAKEFNSGKSIDDVIADLTAKKTGIDTAVDTASGTVQTAANKITPVNPQQAGVNIAEALEQARLPRKTAANKMYAELPNEPLKPNNTAKALDEVEAEFRAGEEPFFPSQVVKRVNTAIKEKDTTVDALAEIYGYPPSITEQVGAMKLKETVGFQDLHSLRKNIGKEIRNASVGQSANYPLVRRLQILKNGIDADIEAGMVGGDYIAARNAYAEYTNTFRTGATGKILARGKEASGLATPYANIPAKVFKPDGADSLTNAMGGGEAGKAKAKIIIEGYAADDFMAAAVNKNTKEINPTAMRTWIDKNKEVLEKFGLTKDFDSINSAQSTLEAAKKVQDGFNKSVAAKMLNADAETAIERAMQGAEGVNAKNTAGIMTDLMNRVKGNKDAVDGLKVAFKDFIIKKTERTLETIGGQKIINVTDLEKGLKRFEPAMKVLYADEPQKLKALLHVQQAVKTSFRSAQSPIGGGSDTAENVGSIGMTILGNVLGSVVGKTGLQVKLAKYGLGALGKLSEKDLNTVMVRALYDPEYAETIMMAKNMIKPAVVRGRMDNLLSIAGIRTILPIEKSKQKTWTNGLIPEPKTEQE